MIKIVNLCVTDKEKKKFLFIKRNKAPFKDYLGMLGGKVEENENEDAAASRELFEESGIDAAGEFLGLCHEKIIENNWIIGEFDIYFYHFIVDEDTKFNSSHEGEIKWILMNEFETTKLIPSDPLMIETFFNFQGSEVNSVIEKKGEEYFQEKFENFKIDNKNGIIEKVRSFVEEECKKPTSKYGYEPYLAHFVPVVKYAKILGKNLNGDLEVIEISAWLHDIGSILYGRENHHITSCEIAEKKLKEFGYPTEKIEKVKHCILAHRGSQNISRQTIEAQIIADADGMSHFDNIGGPMKAAFVYEGLSQLEANKTVREKLIRSYNKLSPFAKEIIKPKYDAVMLLLGNNSENPIENKKPGVGVGVMILKNGKVLLGKRHFDKEKASGLKEVGSWTFPGGKLEYGEDFEEGARRETMEECGIKLNNLKLICVNNDMNENAHFVTIGLFSDEFNGEVQVNEPDKITEWKWFFLSDLPIPLFSPTKKMIENYKQNRFYIGGKT